jgi:hypothetical protein
MATNVKKRCRTALSPATIGHDFGQPARFVKKNPIGVFSVCPFLNLYLHGFLRFAPWFIPKVFTAVYTLYTTYLLQVGNSL